jgi:hypothetical protein
MTKLEKGRAYVSPYLLQPIRTLAEVSAELAKNQVKAARAPAETDGEKLDPSCGDDSRAD